MILPAVARVLGVLAAVILVGAGVALVAGTQRPDATSGVQAAVSSAFQPGGAQAGSGITVFGEGEARAEPDLAIISVGAVHIAPTAREATDEVNRRAAAIVAAARGHGLPDRDIQTSAISLQPITRSRPASDQPPEIQAYRATSTLTLTVRDIGAAGAVLDSATAAGANVVGGLRFAVSDPGELRARALANATPDASRHARAIATAAGAPLGALIGVTDEGAPSAPQPLAAEARALEPPTTAVEPGELVVRARVRARFSLG